MAKDIAIFLGKLYSSQNLKSAQVIISTINLHPNHILKIYLKSNKSFSILNKISTLNTIYKVVTVAI